MLRSKLSERYFSLEHALGQNEFGIGDVAEYLGLGNGHARFIVDRLLKTRCCYRVSRGRYRLIGGRDWVSLRRFCILFPKLAPQILSLLMEYVQEIHSARLCGSVYRGEQDRLSDVDLFIVTRSRDAGAKIERMAKSMNKHFGTRLAPDVFSRDDFERLCRGSFSPFVTLIDSMVLVDDGTYRCAVLRGLEENFYGIVQMELAEARASFNACLKGEKRLTLRDLTYLAIDAWRRIVVAELMLGDEPFTMSAISKVIGSALGPRFNEINQLYRAEKLALSCGVRVAVRTRIGRHEILEACGVGLKRAKEVKRIAEAKKAAAEGR